MKAAALALLVTFYVPANPTGATGEPVLAHLTVAVSQDQRHLLGKWLHIPGVGPRYANDVMPKRWRMKLDVAVDSNQEARLQGRRRVTVEVVR